MAAALDLTASEVFAHPERLLDVAEQQRVATMLSRLLAHEPLSRITKRREFWGLEFELSADTLDPRPDTETLVQAVLDHLADRSHDYRFLDLGTGSGCLLLALLSEYPNASGIGIDVAPGAACTARDNAERLALGGRAAFAVGDWVDAVAGEFEAVVANPPYIATATMAGLPVEVREYDPRRALDGGDDGVTPYRRIAAGLMRLLGRGGVAAVEIGSTQAEAVAAIFAAMGLRIEPVLFDLAGLPRCIVARR